MQINITARDFGGTEFLAQPHRLHLGAQKAEGIITYHFSLCKIRFYIFYTLYFSTAAECGSSMTVILPSSTSYSFGMSE